MTIRECYEIIGGDYDEIINRFRKEERVRKFAVRFLQDPSYDMLCAGVAEKNGDEAFRAAHTLKGVCQNLAFTELYKISEEITEALRDGDFELAGLLMPQVKASYEKTAAGIRLLAESDG